MDTEPLAEEEEPTLRGDVFDDSKPPDDVDQSSGPEEDGWSVDLR